MTLIYIGRVLRLIGKKKENVFLKKLYGLISFCVKA